MPFGIEVMGRVRELGSVDDVVEISRRLGWVRPVLDFAHMHATSDGAFTSRRAVRRGARAGRRGARGRRAVPHPLLGHRRSRTATRRSTCPTARARCARSRWPRRCARFERPATVISESPDEAVVAGDPRDPRRRRIARGSSACSTHRRSASRSSSAERCGTSASRSTSSSSAYVGLTEIDEEFKYPREQLAVAFELRAPSVHRARTIPRCVRVADRFYDRCRRTWPSGGCNFLGRARSPPGARRRGRSSRGSCAAPNSIGFVLEPKVFQAYDVRGIYPSRARRGGRLRDRPGVRRAVRAEADRGRPRHAARLAVDGGGADRGCGRRRRRRRRHRHGRHRDGLFRGRRARPRRRRDGDRVAQPEASTSG